MLLLPVQDQSEMVRWRGQKQPIDPATGQPATDPSGNPVIADVVFIDPSSSVSLAAGQSVAVSALPAVALAAGTGVTIGSPSSIGDGTIQTGGTAQNLFSGVAPVNGYKVFNPHPTEDLWINDNGTAAPNVGIPVFARGGQYSTEPGEKPVGAVSIYGLTSGHAYGARKW